MRKNDPNALLWGEGAELRATQYCDLNWLWCDINPKIPIEILRYSLPGARIALPLEDNFELVNQFFVLGIYMAFFNRNYHYTTVKLSDWPEFAQHVKKLAALRKQLAEFFVDGPVYG